MKLSAAAMAAEKRPGSDAVRAMVFCFPAEVFIVTLLTFTILFSCMSAVLVPRAHWERQ